jgi:hypothetical protein
MQLNIMVLVIGFIYNNIQLKITTDTFFKKKEKHPFLWYSCNAWNFGEVIGNCWLAGAGNCIKVQNIPKTLSPIILPYH